MGHQDALSLSPWVALLKHRDFHECQIPPSDKVSAQQRFAQLDCARIEDVSGDNQKKVTFLNSVTDCFWVNERDAVHQGYSREQCSFYQGEMNSVVKNLGQHR